MINMSSWGNIEKSFSELNYILAETVWKIFYR